MDGEPETLRFSLRHVGTFGKPEAAHGGYHDGGFVLHRAVVLAVAASGALVLVHPGDRDPIARFLLKYDRFVRTNLITDHAAFLLFPRQATRGINNGRARFCPDAFFCRQCPDGICGAHMAAQGALRAAVTAPGCQGRAEQAHETGIEPDGLKGIGGTDCHALAATDAPGQECSFGQGSRWADNL